MSIIQTTMQVRNFPKCSYVWFIETNISFLLVCIWVYFSALVLVISNYCLLKTKQEFWSRRDSVLYIGHLLFGWLNNNMDPFFQFYCLQANLIISNLIVAVSMQIEINSWHGEATQRVNYWSVVTTPLILLNLLFS